MVKIGNASIDEHGKATGGRAGDQTGKEVGIRDWYNRPWNTVLRAEKTADANKIAKAMKQACNNKNIGYDQNQRTTLFERAKNNNFDISKVSAKCETDCSALVAVCINAAGIKVSKDIYTGNMVAAITATKAFKKLTADKYLTTDEHLKKGDILVCNGHTAVALENGSAINNTNASPATTNRKNPYAIPGKTLKNGSKGEGVKWLQWELQNLGFLDVYIDGSYGPVTKKAVKEYQEKKKIIVTGKVAKKTRNLILKK
jgi:hypothetical protein